MRPDPIDPGRGAVAADDPIPGALRRPLTATLRASAPPPPVPALLLRRRGTRPPHPPPPRVLGLPPHAPALPPPARPARELADGVLPSVAFERPLPTVPPP